MFAFSSLLPRPFTHSRSIGLSVGKTSTPPSRFHSLNTRRATIHAVASASSNAKNLVPDVLEDDDDDDEERRTITLTDNDSGLDLQVYLHEETEFEGTIYNIVVPCMDPISIVGYEQVEDIGYNITNVDDYKPLIPAARAALQEQQMDLIEAGFIGMLLDEDLALDEEILGENDEDNDDDDESDEHDGEALEEVEVLAEFDHQGASYSVVRQTALQFMVTTKNANGEHEIVESTEFPALQAHLEEVVANWKDGEV